MSYDLIGPSNAPNSVTTRPADSRATNGAVVGAADTWFQDCTSPTANDGTKVMAAWLNSIMGQLRNAIRGNGNLAASSSPVVMESDADDSMLLKAFQYLFQRGQPVYAPDTGTAGALVATLSPAPPELKAGMAIRIKAAFDCPSGGAVTLNVNGFGAKSVVHSDGTPLPQNAYRAGGIETFTFDGAVWQMGRRQPGVLTSLQVAANYYVNPVTGSDANNGLTAGTAWATLNYAWRWLQQNINANGQQITINCAFPNSPTNYAQFLALGGITGVFTPGQIVILGDTTNQRCRIDGDFSGSGAVYASANAMFAIRGFYLQATGTLAAGLYVSSAQVSFGEMQFGTCTAYAIQSTGSGANAMAIGPVTFNGSGVSAVRASQNAVAHMDSYNVVFNGITCSGGTFSAIDLGTITAINTVFTGTGVNGPRFSLAMGSVLDTNGAQATSNTAYVPGTSAGTTASGGNFQ
ncbi:MULTISPECIES: hypothetical protein [unclassified Bradyrhizobium]|uniref:hypothetical protein n=1 Tax=unclassified Bradyrhizobium TaxID=2631580 RepID=UPI0029170ED2|nr:MULTISPECIES: hypothetical protein [unclassified Bradyrhizobium]